MRRLAIAIVVGSLSAAFALIDDAGLLPGVSPQRWSLDYLFWLRHHIVGPLHDSGGSPTAIVVIDEETYSEEPFKGLPQVAWTPQLGTVINALGESGAKVVGVDLLYPTTLYSLI